MAHNLIRGLYLPQNQMFVQINNGVMCEKYEKPTTHFKELDRLNLLPNTLDWEKHQYIVDKLIKSGQLDGTMILPLILSLGSQNADWIIRALVIRKDLNPTYVVHNSINGVLKDVEIEKQIITFLKNDPS